MKKRFLFFIFFFCIGLSVLYFLTKITLAVTFDKSTAIYGVDSARISDCSVIGGALEWFIDGFHVSDDECQIDKIFIDETGYSAITGQQVSVGNVFLGVEGETSAQLEIISLPESPTETGSTPEGTQIIASAPQIILTSPVAGAYSKVLSINYLASDSDTGKGALKDQPVVIFYSGDGGINWKEIANNQPAAGIYNFDTTAVPDGTNYRIRVTAFDGYDYSGEAMSETLSIDNAGPTFDVSISPFPVREKDTITLKITSSEELKAPPKLQITQNSAEPKIITASGSRNKFFSSYYVERGSGKAAVSVRGEDLLGNVGEVITSGASFLVGFFGPPPPTIKTPVNNQVFTDAVVSVTGSGQPGTEIILTLNGVTKSAVQSLSGGDFKIDNVVLSAANKGYNTLSIVNVDKKGEESGEVVLKIKLNSPPKISSTSIGAKEIISGQKEIIWLSSDSNDDKLVFSIEYSNDEGASWDYIVSGLSEASYKIDTLQLADGSNYFLRITADDGTEKVSQIFKKVAIKNNLPFILLDVPANYFTNINAPVLTGKVIGSEQNIALAEYSLDGGTNWQRAIALDGQFGSLTEKIKIPVAGPLKDGKYTILIRATDVLGRTVKISRSFNIDTVAPFIEMPPIDKTVSNSADTNLGLEGLQVDFGGKTEPQAQINLILKDKIYKAVAGEKGEFEVKDVTLPFHGANEISLTSTDLAGNISKINGVVTSNNPPQVSVLSPKEGEFFGGVKEIGWESKDPDNDPMVTKILYQKKSGDWIGVADDLGGGIYKWDVSKIANGDYKIKIVSSDGISEGEKIVNVFIDNIAPQIKFSGPSVTNDVRPTFSGLASDDFSGIEYLEYSFNNADWYKASIVRGYQTKEAGFLFRPQLSAMEEGNYKVMARATDRAGNIAYSEPKELTIDSTPPPIGSILISSGSLILFPDETGAIKLFKGLPYKILLSVAREAKEVTLGAKERVFSLGFNKAISLWESEIIFSEAGDNPLVVSVRDEAGNSQKKEVAFLKVIPPGVVLGKGNDLPIEGAEVLLSVFNQTVNSWSAWDGQAFDQKNPQKTNEKGEYGFLIPPGKYRLEVSKRGFGTARTQDLRAENNYLINANIFLAEKAGLFDKVFDYFVK
jgi:hypothetical protein